MAAYTRSSLQKIDLMRKISWHTFTAMKGVQAAGNPENKNDRVGIRKVAKIWADSMLNLVGIEPIVTGKPVTNEPVLYVANHIGYIDIPLVKSVVEVSFVAKKEVRHWPIFGPAAVSAGTAFVNRSDPESRKNVADQIGRFMVEQGRSVAIFPEGTSSMFGKPWKRGSFVVAAKFGIKVQPIRIAFNPLRPCAYIDSDHFSTHLWNLLSFQNIQAHVHFFDPIKVTDVDKEVPDIQHLVQENYYGLLDRWGIPLEKSKDY